MVGMFESESEAADLPRALSCEGIESETDRIPYNGTNDPRFRVFVYVRDVFKVKDSSGQGEFTNGVQGTRAQLASHSLSQLHAADAGR
jgi:hypothetical protein